MKSISIALLLITWHLITSIKEIEKCLLDQIKGFESDYLYLMDHEILTTIATDFNLLPRNFQEAMITCLADVEENDCEKIHGTGKCEKVGLVKVPMCETGFERVDYGICVRKCPPETIPDAGGFLCLKPKVKTRKSFKDKESCLKEITGDACKKSGRFYLHSCDKDFQELGSLMCEYICPENQGFEDDGIWCIPPTKEFDNFYLNIKPGKLKYNPKTKSFGKFN